MQRRRIETQCLLCTLLLLCAAAGFGQDRDTIRIWIDDPYDANSDGAVDYRDLFYLAEVFHLGAVPTPTPDPVQADLPPIGDFQEFTVQGQENTLTLDFPTGREAYLVIIRNGETSGSQSETSLELPFEGAKPVPKPSAEVELLQDDSTHAYLHPKVLTVPGDGVAERIVVPQALSLGDRESFDLFGGVTVNATLRYLGTHAAIYVDDTNWMQGETNVDQAFVDAQGEHFDTVTYPNVTSVFGEPGDVNKDGHIAILLTTGAATTDLGIGFFFGGDLVKRNQLDPNFPTNEREIFYVAPPNTPGRSVTADDVFNTVGHELQHLISFYHHAVEGRNLPDGLNDEERWLDEGMSHLAEDFVQHETLPNANRIRLYFENQAGIGLFVDNFVPTNTQRGGGYLFSRYLADRFGSSAIQNLAVSRKLGIENVESATGQPIEELLRDWTRALFFSDLNILDDARYQYTHFASLDVAPGRWWGKPQFLDFDLDNISFFGALFYGFMPGGSASYTVLRGSASGSKELLLGHWSGVKPIVEIVRLPDEFLYPSYFPTEGAWSDVILDEPILDIVEVSEPLLIQGRSADGQPFQSFEYFICSGGCGTIFSSWIQNAAIEGDRFEFEVQFDQAGQWDVGLFVNGSNLRNRITFTAVDELPPL